MQQLATKDKPVDQGVSTQARPAGSGQGTGSDTKVLVEFEKVTQFSERMALTYFLRGGCAIYFVLKKSIRYVPETANVPEDGATLHVQKGPNCAIYSIFNLNPFFRDCTFRSSKR